MMTVGGVRGVVRRLVPHLLMLLKGADESQQVTEAGVGLGSVVYYDKVFVT